MRLESLGTAAAVFLVALGVYVASAPIVPESHDTTSNAYVPVSLLTHGDVVFAKLWLARAATGRPDLWWYSAIIPSALMY